MTKKSIVLVSEKKLNSKFNYKVMMAIFCRVIPASRDQA